MAARQDQTLQIALIVFAILLVIALGFVWYFHSTSQTQFARAEAAEKDRNEKQTQLNKFLDERNAFLAMIGSGQADDFVGPQDATAEAVSAQFAKDMERTGDPSIKNYRKAVEVFYRKLAEVNGTLIATKDQLKNLETKLKEVEAGHQSQVTQYKTQIASIQQEAAKQRAQFDEARETLKQSQDKLATDLATTTNQFDQERAQLNDSVATMQGEVNKRDRTIEDLQARIIVESPTFEVPDGRIKWVNQANNTVWIDLGPADALRRQVTFSVYDTEDNDAQKAKKKGKIEVIRMLGDHMAEARVTEDNPRNPILPGDYIYSPVWHQGKPQHFAFTGKIDLNDDGRSDLELAKELISINGGVVDAFPDEEGKMSGEISVQTRYLVVGEYPEGSDEGALRETWERMHGDAKSSGTELITLTDFMNLMGYKPDDRTVGLTGPSRAENFRPRPNSGSSDLRPRTPYVD
jgi:predicted RNase H-like nuclease (RuvC/YqgF family)